MGADMKIRCIVPGEGWTTLELRPLLEHAVIPNEARITDRLDPHNNFEPFVISVKEESIQ